MDLSTLLSSQTCVGHCSETVVGNLIGKILKDMMGIINISMCCSIDSSTITELFSIFNVSGDGSMSIEEFRFCYNEWIKKVSQSFRSLKNSMLTLSYIIPCF